MIQLSYAIGVSSPTSIMVNTFGKSRVNFSDSEISEKISSIFDLTPFGIEERLKLRNPIYSETAAYGHMGRQPLKINKTFDSPYSGRVIKQVELFTWEKLDYVKIIKEKFKL